MSKVWQDMKSDISTHVTSLKKELQQIYKSDYDNQTVNVLVKFKDNFKNALVTIVHAEKQEAKSELEITLDNAKNLRKRFEQLLKEFGEKVVKLS